jgi:hypothetical protein
MGTGGPFPGGKAPPGRDADHSPPSSAEVRNEYELYSSPPSAISACSGDCFALSQQEGSSQLSVKITVSQSVFLRTRTSDFVREVVAMYCLIRGRVAFVSCHIARNVERSPRWAEKFINSEYISENSSYCAPSRGTPKFYVHRVIHKLGAASCSGRAGGRP